MDALDAAALDATGAVRVVCDAGPDCGAAVLVGADPVVVGRSPTCDLTVDDAAAELHHLMLTAADPGVVRVTQLSGRTVARVGEHPLGPGALVAAGGVVTFGATRLRVEDPSAPSRPGPMASVVEVLAAPGGVRRTRDDGTMFRVHVGFADAAGDVTIDLEPGAVCQLAGPGAAGVARSLIVQLASQVPADRLAIRIVGANGWLPDGVRLAHLEAPDTAEHIVVFAADPLGGSLGLPAWRARLALPPDAAIVAIDDRVIEPNPSWPGARLGLGGLGRGRWAPGPDVAGSLLVHAAAVTTATVVRWSAAQVPPPAAPDPPPPPVPLETIAVGRSVETIKFVRSWRRASGAPALWLGRDGATTMWLPLGRGPVVVVGTDATRRAEVLATYAAALALDQPPAALALVVGEGVAGPGPTHAIGAPLAPARIGHELARPRPRDGRVTVVVADDPHAAAVATDLVGTIPAVAAAARAADRHLIIGLSPDHPWCTALLSDPTSTVVVSRIDDLTVARRLVADSRATRLTPEQVIVRPPGQPFRVVTLPRLDEAAHVSLASTLGHAVALTGSPVPPTASTPALGATPVRSCEPCPDDDSPWARPSSDRSSATMLVPASSTG